MRFSLVLRQITFIKQLYYNLNLRHLCRCERQKFWFLANCRCTFCQGHVDHINPPCGKQRAGLACCVFDALEGES